jgi:hypothetical protein
MTPRQFNNNLLAAGFRKRLNKLKIVVFTRGAGASAQHLSRESVRGSAWRLFLAVGSASDAWPAISKPNVGKSLLEAESPWLEYYSSEDLLDPQARGLHNGAEALDACWRWLSSVGFEWLADPRAKSGDWAREQGILLRGSA